MTFEHLLKYAAKASKFAYTSKRSNSVGAAVVLKNAEIFTGCFIESDSGYICAEQVAINNVISHGKDPADIVAIAVYRKPEKEHRHYKPDKNCISVISEYCEPNTFIITTEKISKLYNLQK